MKTYQDQKANYLFGVESCLRVKKREHKVIYEVRWYREQSSLRHR